jgi:ubiquinone/menaquinone biosynthesis C-methylase UbiE
MKPTNDYWRNWFDERAKKASSDFVLNRGTTLRLEALEKRAQIQFLNAIDPKPIDVVLDAGCGSGRNISLLSPLVKEIIGLDFSKEMLRHAQERIQNEKLTNVKLISGSVTELKFDHNVFDKLVCASVLQYLDDAQCALAIQEMIRVCKPGGTLVLHVKNGTSLYALSLRLTRMFQRMLGKPVMPEYYRPRSWHLRTIKNCGAEVVDFDAFGIFTFTPLPRWFVQQLLQLELLLVKGNALKRFGVNFKLTVRVNVPKSTD